MNKLISVHNVHKSFPIEEEATFEVIKGISIELSEPQIFGIMGESGAGKSTLLNIISTIDVPTSGEVELCGKNILSMSEKELSEFRNKYIGFIYQFHHLLPEFSVMDNVLMPARISGGKLDKQRAKELLELVGLSHRLEYSVKKLSGGEQQRVSIARSLMNQPKIIFCDEPTGNLDHANTENLFTLFQRLSRELGMTFVIVSHSAMLKLFSDKLIILEDGVVKEELLMKNE